MFVPELLSPAGTLKAMRYAFAYGADAVYAGQPRYSLRVRNNEFSIDALQQGIDEAHSLGKKLYVVSNISPHNGKVRTYLRDMAPVIEMKPDALIMSDPGLIMLVREQWPEMPIHLSVQANAINFATVRFWQKQGVSRVILSRELSLEEIAEIRAEVPEMELEVFVHGALCMAYSGRCLLSGYINKRDPNQGTCTNACRWKYSAHEAYENSNGDAIAFDPKVEARIDPTLGIGAPTSKLYLLEEENRPGELMPTFEDEHGTYIMNSRDLRAIQHIEQLTRLGVHSLKIEGRTKSFYYVARTAQTYRQAIDDAVSGKGFNPALLRDLEHLAHRGYTEGFLRRHTHDAYQHYEAGSSSSSVSQFVGEVKGQREDGMVEIEVKNRFAIGQPLQLMTTRGNIELRLDHMENAEGTAMMVAPGAGYTVYARLPDGVAPEQALLVRLFDEADAPRAAAGGCA